MTRRQGLLLAALGLAGLALVDPRIPLPQAVYRYLWVIDITQSMNTPDYRQANQPADRLGYVKSALRATLPELPCGSEVGLGVFTSHMTQVLFEPLEVCGHIGVIDDVIAHLDWRMAWAANSQIDQGVATALHRIREADSGWRLVFFTDGQTAPGEPRQPDFSQDRGKIKGILIGTGATEPSLVPRFDRENRPLGYFLEQDVNGGEVPSGDGYYRSWLDETHLRTLAATAGLEYYRLDSVANLIGQLTNNETLSDYRRVPQDLRPLTALLALGLILLALSAEF